MADPFLGEIRLFGGAFAPRGWALCNGQLTSISQNAALFSILGTSFGGDGVQTFGLPNLQGSVPMHWGNGVGLTPRVIGETGGVESVNLLPAQMPQHTHPVLVNGTGVGNAITPTGNYLGSLARGGAAIYSTGTDRTTLNPAAVSNAGGSQPHTNLQPFQCVTFIIALAGIFPSRN